MRRRLAVLAALVALGCAHRGEPDIATLASNSEQVIWEAAQKDFEGRNWESARKYYKRILDAFPQSTLGPGARLGLADSYVQEGGTANYVLAISEYRQFLTLYPSHPRSAYAQFQVGECYFRQRNGPDRDQTQTEKDLEEFQRLLDLYPSSSQGETARERIKTCRQTLARSDFMVAYFYQRSRRACRASIPRYEHILNEYPDFEQIDEVLYRLAECLTLAGRPAEARPRLAKLLDSYPTSSFADAARALDARLAETPAPPQETPTPAPAASPSPASPDPGSAH